MIKIYNNFIKEANNIKNVKIVKPIEFFCNLFFENPRYCSKDAFERLNEYFNGECRYYILENYPLQFMQLIPEKSQIFVFENKDEFNANIQILRDQGRSLDKKLGEFDKTLNKRFNEELKKDIKTGIGILNYIEGAYQRTYNSISNLIEKNKLNGG